MVEGKQIFINANVSCLKIQMAAERESSGAQGSTEQQQQSTEESKEKKEEKN